MKDKVLIDTSVWIEFFRKSGSEGSSRLRDVLVEERAAITGIISLELQRGAAGETELRFLDRFLAAIHYIPTKEELYKNAGFMGYNLSKKGKIIDLTTFYKRLCYENRASDIFWWRYLSQKSPLHPP